MRHSRSLAAVLLALGLTALAAPAAADHYSVSDGTTCHGGEIATGTMLEGLVTTMVTPLRTHEDGSVTYTCVFTRLPARSVDEQGNVDWERPARGTATTVSPDSCAVAAPTGGPEDVWFGTATHRFSSNGTLRLDCVVHPPQ